MLIKSCLEQSMAINDYLYWSQYSISSPLSSTLQDEYSLLYDRSFPLNKHAYLLNTETTIKNAKEEKAELDKFEEFNDY